MICESLNADLIKVTAYDSLKNEYKIKFTVLDKNTIEISPKEKRAK